MAASGAIAGMWYGLADMVRRSLVPGIMLNAAADFLSAAGVCAVITGALVIALEGEVRLYALAGAAGGFALERITAGRALREAARHLLKLSRRWKGRMAGTKWWKFIFR